MSEYRTQEEAVETLLARLLDVSVLLHDINPGRSGKPIIGGQFGTTGFSMGTVHCVKGQLDQITFYVLDCTCGLVIGVGSDKQQCLHLARGVLKKVSPIRYQRAKLDFAGRLRLIREEAERLAEEEAEQRREAIASEPKVRSIPKRRQEIFDKSEGKCHYCGVALTLDGKWHVEHKMPRALGGDDAPGNLVASCAKCNHEKRDRTDQEYLAKRAARKGATA